MFLSAIILFKILFWSFILDDIVIADGLSLTSQSLKMYGGFWRKNLPSNL